MLPKLSFAGLSRLKWVARLLVRLLYQRKWDKQRVIDLFGVIDWMMRLSEELEQQLWQEIESKYSPPPLKKGD